MSAPVIDEASLPSNYFGRRVRLLREASGLAQERVAERMCRLGHLWQQTTVSKVEAGFRSVTLDEAYCLVAVLGQRLDDFLSQDAPSSDDLRACAEALRGDAEGFEAIADSLEALGKYLTFGPTLVVSDREQYRAMAAKRRLAAEQADSMAMDREIATWSTHTGSSRSAEDIAARTAASSAGESA